MAAAARPAPPYAAPGTGALTIAELNGVLAARPALGDGGTAARPPLGALAVEAPRLRLEDAPAGARMYAVDAVADARMAGAPAAWKAIADAVIAALYPPTGDGRASAPAIDWHPSRPYLAVCHPDKRKVLVYDLSDVLGGHSPTDAKAREALGANTALRREGAPPDPRPPTLELAHEGLGDIGSIAWRPRHPGQLLAAGHGGYVLWTLRVPTASARASAAATGGALPFGKARGGTPRRAKATDTASAPAPTLAGSRLGRPAPTTALTADVNVIKQTARWFASGIRLAAAARLVWRPDGRMAAAVHPAASSASSAEAAAAAAPSPLPAPLAAALSWIGGHLPNLAAAGVQLISPVDESVQTVRTDAIACTDVAFSPCTRYLLVSGEGGALRLYATARFASVAFHLGEPVAGIAWAPETTVSDEASAVVVLASGSALSLVVPSAPPARTATLLPLVLPELPQLAQERGGCTGAAWDARGNRLVVGFGGGEAAVYQTVRTPMLAAHLMGIARMSASASSSKADSFAFHPAWPRGALLAASVEGEADAAVLPFVIDT